ncbi:MAG: hypothetical protein HYR56_29430 [Acidobacteria bacterium]|nr:hypothetical protein [Acidobacteriota bacterium]MBI3421501.1 hypothetical protein [Acidobacteriota bacterium]
MTKRTESKQREWLTAMLLCLIVSAVAALPFFYIGEDRAVGCCGGEAPITHDAWMHFNQMQAFARGLAAGRVYPRWDEATHNGYGAPTLSFYPPGAYYLTSFWYLITRDWQRVWLLTWWTMLFASGLALYAYARESLGHGAALLAMTVYVVMPYHLLNQYQRGALAEQLSFVWMPLCLLFAERLGARAALPADRAAGAAATVTEAMAGNHKTLLAAACGLAFCYGAFLFSHPPTAYQFTLVFGVFIAGLAIWRRQGRTLALLAAALLFGAMLAGAYFVPAFLEQPFIHANDVSETWPYHTTYVFDYRQTRFNRFDPFIARLDFLWAFNAGLLLLGARALLRWSPAFRQSLRLTGQPPEGGTPNAIWLASGVFASFLMTRYSAPLGRLIPKLEIGVFAWRMLGLTSLVVALLAGLCVQAALQEANNETAKWRRFALVSIAWLMLFASAGVSFWKVAWPMVRAEAFRENPQHYNYATLPAQVPREAPPLPEAQFVNADAGEIKVLVWQPEFRRLQVRAKHAEQLQLRTSDFPGWTALLDGRVVPSARGPVGNITLAMPAGEHTVVLEFRSTPVRRVGNWLTVVSCGLWLALVIFSFKQLFQTTERAWNSWSNGLNR